ncbi:uncharacterized protein LOC141898283 [Tubulanus polymorphus]|uniref:uncharacterized protein LOC141898283 n=1 Tax=Tubulanus polymorphus TaxID=672921 RepID=UPI003DA1F299
MLLDVNMPTTSSIQAWLGRELELRGIDAMIYTRYILSILQQDNFELEHTEPDVFTPKKQIKAEQVPSIGKNRNKKHDKKSLDGDELKKTAAVECLLSVTDEGSGIESLVEETYNKLKQQKQGARSKSPGTSGEEDGDKRMKNRVPTERYHFPHILKVYYEAFPPLSDKLVKGAPPVQIKPEESWSHKVSISPSDVDRKSAEKSASVAEKSSRGSISFEKVSNPKPPRQFVIYKTKRKQEFDDSNPYFIVPKMSPTCGKLPTGLLDCDDPAHRKMKEEILRLIRREASICESSSSNRGKNSNGQTTGVDGPHEDWSWYTEPLYKMFPPTSLRKGRLYQRKVTADENQNIEEEGDPLSETDILQSIKDALEDGREVWWCTEPGTDVMLDGEKGADVDSQMVDDCNSASVSVPVDDEKTESDEARPANNTEEDVLKCFTTPLPRIESESGHKASRFLPYILKRMNKESMLTRLSESSASQCEKVNEISSARSLSESDASAHPVADLLDDAKAFSGTDDDGDDDENEVDNGDDVLDVNDGDDNAAVVVEKEDTSFVDITSNSAEINELRSCCIDDGYLAEPARKKRDGVDSPLLGDSFFSLLDWWDNNDVNDNEQPSPSPYENIDNQKTSVVSQLEVNTEFENIANDLIDELNERYFDWTNVSSMDVGFTVSPGEKLNSPQFLSFRWNLMSPGSTSVWSCRWETSSTMVSPAQPLERYFRRGLYSTTPPLQTPNQIGNKWFETALFLSTSLDTRYREPLPVEKIRADADVTSSNESMLCDAIKSLINREPHCQTVGDIVKSLREIALNHVYNSDDDFNDRFTSRAELAPDGGAVVDEGRARLFTLKVSPVGGRDELCGDDDDNRWWDALRMWDDYPGDRNDEEENDDDLSFDWDFFIEPDSTYSHVSGVGAFLKSEFSAFNDSIPRRLPHVKSESDLKPILHRLTRHNSDSNLFAKTAPVIHLRKLAADEEKKEVCPPSPNALYSPQTHFKPIRSLSHDSNSTAGNSDSTGDATADTHNQNASDLIYSYDWVDGYQSYCLDEKATTDAIRQKFIPKFRLNLDGDKWSQTNGLSPEKETPPEQSLLSIQHILPEIREGKESTDSTTARESSVEYDDFTVDRSSLYLRRRADDRRLLNAAEASAAPVGEYLSDEEYNQFTSHFSLSQLISGAESTSSSSRNDDAGTRGSSRSGSYCVPDDVDVVTPSSSYWTMDFAERDVFHEEREPIEADDLDVMMLCSAHIQSSGDSTSSSDSGGDRRTTSTLRDARESDIKTPQLLISNDDTVDQSLINVSLPRRRLDEADGFSDLWSDEPTENRGNIWSSGGMSLDLPLSSSASFNRADDNELKSKSLGDLDDDTADYYASEPWSDGIAGDTFAGHADVFTDEISEQLINFPSPPRDGVLYSSELEDHWLNSDSSGVHKPRKRVKGSIINKPCSFFMEGNCRRKGCRFSHDLSTITCRFWERGECFKDFTCPFLHGYPTVNMFDDTDGEQYSDDSGNVTLDADDILSFDIPVSHHLQGGGSSRKKHVPLFKRRNGKKNRSTPSADIVSKDGDI